MKKQENIYKSPLLDMGRYRLQGSRRDVLPVIYTPLPRRNGRVPFDIYDYRMLFNDTATRELIRSGNTIGCFYIESPGMRSLLRRLQVDNFELLTAASSVIRPGVAESGMMQEFIARHRDPRRRKYLVPELEKYLGETYGVMIYQEDVIKVAHHVAGLTLEEADLLRRAMSGKLRSHEAMKALSDKFLDSCRRKGYSARIAEELWRQIASFAGYAFCKAHSASFALLSYQVAYLKVHYPAEFMASVLSNGGGYYAPAVYIQECKRMGLEVKLPCINSSRYEYTGRGREVRIGLMAIKHFSYSGAEKLVRERVKNGRYKSLSDLLARTGLGREDTALLIRCGATDCLGVSRPQLMRLLDIYIAHRGLLNDLFADETLRLEKEGNFPAGYSPAEVAAIEYETFDYMVTYHPLEFFGEWTSQRSVVRAAQMSRYDGKRVRMIGWFMTSKRIRTRKGEIMKFLSLEDTTGTFEAVLFPKTYAKYAENTLSMGPYLLEGKVDGNSGNNLIVETLQVLTSFNIKAVMQKDSAENNYYGDVEKISSEEFAVVSSLQHAKLVQLCM